MQRRVAHGRWRANGTEFPMTSIPRRPPPYAIAALDVLAKVDRRQMPWGEFRAAMAEWSSLDTSRAIASLERRGWVVFANERILITDAGYLAATTGEGVPGPRRVPRKVSKTKHARLPRGLF